MATQLNDSLMVNSPLPLDGKYTKKSGSSSVPYTSVSDVNVNIPTAYRYVGLTVLVSEGGVNAEYWYKEGTGNDKLIRKYPDGIALGTVGTSGPASLVNGLLNIPDYSAGVAGVSSFNNRNGSITLTSQDIITSLGFTPIQASYVTWQNITSKPSFSTVATSGSYEDLGSKPLIPAQLNLSQGTGISISGTYPNLTITATPQGTNGGTVTNVTGAANRISVNNNTTTPTVDIASNYAGQSTISTVGTITTGIWNGTPIANSNLANSTLSLQVSSSGTDIVPGGTASLGGILQLNIPNSSASVTRGALLGSDWTRFNNKQDSLVSGTNIKSINGSSILGSGNLVISGGAAYSQNFYDGKLNGGMTGDGSTDDTTTLQSSINSSFSQKKTLYIPAGIYLIKGTVGLKSNIHIVGAGIGLTILKYDSTFAASNSGYMLEGDGMSYIEIEGITFQGDHDKQLPAFIGFNSYNNANRQVSVHHCEFKEANVIQAVTMGGTANGQTHSNTDVYIHNNYFHDLYKTGYQNPAEDGIDANLLCRGVNLNQPSRLVEVYRNRFENLSGDGLFGQGQNNMGNYLGGNIHIHDNFFYNCQMGVEINGNYLGYNQTIEHNYFYWMRLTGGYAISTDSYNCKILNNYIFQHDRSAIEYTSLGGLIQGNTIVISPYVSGEGYAPAAITNKANAVELYGYANRVVGNTIILKRWTGAASMSPTHYNCFYMIGMNTEVGQNYQPETYPGYSDGNGGNITGSPAGFVIENNYCENPSLSFILADDYNFYHVLVQNNVIIGKYGGETLIQGKGDFWTVKGNTFNMTGNTYTGKNIMSFSSVSARTIFTQNVIMNDAWTADNQNYSAWDNTFQTSEGIEYNLYSSPPITQSQRTLLTPKEGMQVYQTDGIKGTYTYTNGSWVH